MTYTPYHSALKNGKEQDAKPLPTGLVYFDDRNNSVQVWDVNTQPIPEEFYECDIIYAEPMWPAGIKNFDERAGVATPSYREHCFAIRSIITKLQKPTVLTLGMTMLRYLNPPDITMECLLNGNKVNAGFWNGAFSAESTSHEIIKDLATRYDRVGDFCAGYGSTGRLFIEAGKSAVMSDYNAKCCGFIAQEMGGWGNENPT